MTDERRPAEGRRQEAGRLGPGADPDVWEVFRREKDGVNYLFLSEEEFDEHERDGFDFALRHQRMPGRAAARASLRARR